MSVQQKSEPPIRVCLSGATGTDGRYLAEALHAPADVLIDDTHPPVIRDHPLTALGPGWRWLSAPRG